MKEQILENLKYKIKTHYEEIDRLKYKIEALQEHYGWVESNIK